MEGEERGGIASLWADTAWVLTACGSIGWGWLAAALMPHSACTSGHWLAAGIAVQAVLTVAALGLTVARGARYRMHWAVVLFLLGIVIWFSFPGLMALWLNQSCWNLTM